MNGKNYLLDTNAIIQLLMGNKFLIHEIQDANLVAISIISKLEFLSFPRLTESDKRLFGSFEKRVSVISLDDCEKLNSAIVNLRIKSSIKLPDAIISASALVNECTLITSDKKLLDHSFCDTMDFPLI